MKRIVKTNTVNFAGNAKNAANIPLLVVAIALHFDII
jgi:hypothetical protein